MSGDLFDWSKSVRGTDPDTSLDAALSAGEFAGRMHGLILGVLDDMGVPLAAEQIADCLPSADKVQVCKRFCELERAGLIVKTDEKHTNRSGRGAYRYRLGDGGRRDG